MNRDALKFAVLVVLCVFLGTLIGLIATAIFAPPAHAAALLDMDGKKIVVLTGDEFVATAKQRDDEIARLQLELARVRKGCPET